MLNEEIRLLQTAPLRLKGVSRRRLRANFDDFATDLLQMSLQMDLDLLCWRVVVIRSDTTDHRFSNQLWRRITKSKSTRQADNPAVLLGVFSMSSQCNPNSLHPYGSKIRHQKFWDNSLLKSSHFKLPYCPVPTAVPAGPRYCY